MVSSPDINLSERHTEGAQVIRSGPAAWRLEIPAGPVGHYRLAQVDDYTQLRRGVFPWRPPLTLSLRGRAAAENMPGTWGFGLWNDPFGLAFVKGGGLRLPCLPDAAWFFFASPPNYLSLRDDLPAQGALAATFRSPGWSAPLYLLGAPALPLIFWRRTARWLRVQAQRFVQQDAAALNLNPAEWHTYRLDWRDDGVTFTLDGLVVLETEVTPGGPLGLVLWVDNQYAAWTPDGRLAYGTVANPDPAWIEIEGLQVHAE
jgi:hypothetical protein